jgi:hypothetical protein
MYSPAEIVHASPTTRYELAIPTRLDPKNAKAIVCVVEGNSLDQAGQRLPNA